MLQPSNLKDYQRECVLHALYNDHTMLWLQMGLGKTIISLTTIVDRMRSGQVKKTLIFGPLRVVNSVWHTEAKKWTHTKHLRFSIVSGDKQQRVRALFRPADVYLINYENMNWLTETLNKYYLKCGKPLPFDMVIYDEISKLKNSQSVRVNGTKKTKTDRLGNEYSYKIPGWKTVIDCFKYRMGLTGTPAPNGYLDLFGQYLVIDSGKRLGKYITHYKETYFKSDYNGWTFSTTELGKQMIEQKIHDITKKMDAKDYLKMPKCKEVNVLVDLPPDVMKQYRQLEQEMFTALDSGTEVEVFNRASLSNKCLQFCNGTPYTNLETREFEKLHDAKLKALEDVLEEAGGSPVLCSYTFKSDASRIMKHFKKYKPVNLTETPANMTQSITDKWNEGKIKLLIGHPASIGHGIDGLQKSGSIVVWFGLNWSHELYEQMNGRINRQGQTKPVSIIRILCNNTVDLAVLDAINRKHSDQESLKRAIDRYRNRGNVVKNFSFL